MLYALGNYQCINYQSYIKKEINNRKIKTRLLLICIRIAHNNLSDNLYYVK